MKEVEKSSIKFTLVKRKFMFFMKTYSSVNVSLDFFDKYTSKYVVLKFPYKDGKFIEAIVCVK